MYREIYEVAVARIAVHFKTLRDSVRVPTDDPTSITSSTSSPTNLVATNQWHLQSGSHE